MTRTTAILTIAGSDSGSGAGIQADLRTARALGVHACTAITAITAQNPRGLSAWRPVAPTLVAAQIESALSGFRIGAIKTGLLPDARTIQVIARALRKHRRIPLVVDPVLGSTSGTRFLDAAGVRALKKHLFPLATLVTPNWPEAAELAGFPVRNEAEAEAAGRMIALEHGCAVLVKGGHAPGKTCTDYLISNAGVVSRFSHRRIATRNTHGTGCVLSSAIACELAGWSALTPTRLTSAITTARRFLTTSLRKNRHLNWRGRGPALA